MVQNTENINLFKLHEILSNEKAALVMFQHYDIVPKEKTCHEGHPMTLIANENRQRWRCSLRSCREECPIRKQTWLEGSRLSFVTILKFIYSWSREYTSITFCETELEMNKNTTVDFNNYLREVCAASLLRSPCVIGGEGLDVEIDESCFARRKYNVGRMLPTQWVFGGYCRQTKECFLIAVENRSAASLIPIINQYIRPGSTIYSDEWKAYRSIENFEHLTVCHKYNFVDPDTLAHTQGIESQWHLAKMRNKKQCGTARNHIDSYLCEFMWRRRNNGRNLFTAILNDIARCFSYN